MHRCLRPEKGWILLNIRCRDAEAVCALQDPRDRVSTSHPPTCRIWHYQGHPGRNTGSSLPLCEQRVAWGSRDVSCHEPEAKDLSWPVGVGYGPVVMMSPQYEYDRTPLLVSKTRFI